MKKDDFYSFLRKIPKAEIHLHAEATISRKTVQAFLDRRPDNKDHPVDVDQLFSYHNLKDFIASFLFVQGLIDKTSDLATLFEDVASYLKDNNIVYCELFFAPSMFMKKGLDFAEMLTVIQKSIDTIERRDHLTIKLIVDVSRTFGVENAQTNLDLTLAHQTPMVIGVGLGGDEEKGPAGLFGEVFRIARSRGLHVVAHGLSAIQDPELVRYLAEKQIPVEICLTSNLITEKYVTRAEDHPVRPLYDQGVLVVINTDDPTFFNCTIIDEFWLLHTKLKFTMDEIKQLVINGFQASFLEAPRKAAYISQVEKAWEAAILKV